MIVGNVINLHAIVSTTLVSPQGKRVDVEVVIDTGFTGELCLSRSLVQSLGLPLSYETQAYLADHSQIKIPVHEVSLVWNGAIRTVDVLATGERPLLGTALLDGYELIAQFTYGGIVTIQPI